MSLARCWLLRNSGKRRSRVFKIRGNMSLNVFTDVSIHAYFLKRVFIQGYFKYAVDFFLEETITP